MKTLDISLAPPPTLSATVRDLVRRLSRRRVLFAGVAVVIAGGCAAASLSLSPKYTAIATVAVVPDTPDPLTPGRNDVAGLRDDEVATQAQFLTSLDLAATVVKQTGFGAVPRPAPLARWPALYQATCPGPFDIGVVSELCGTSPIPSADARIISFLAALRAVAVPRTRIIELSFTDADPKIAADSLNRLVEAYQQQQIARRTADLARTSNWVSARSEELRQSWLAAEKRVGDFRAATGLVGTNANEGGGQPLLTHQMLQAATSLAASQDETLAARARESGGSATLRPADEPVLLALGSQLATLRAQRASLQATQGDQNPALVAIDRQIAFLGRQLSLEQSVAESRISAELRAKQTKVAEDRRALDELRSNANQLGSKVATLSTLQNEARSAGIVFETFLSRARQLEDRSALLQPQIDVVSHAAIPHASSFPNVPRFLAAGVLAGLLGGGLAVVLLESFAAGVTDIDRIGQRVGTPLLCCIPLIARRSWNPLRPKRRGDEAALVESMRTLAAHLALDGQGDGRPTARSVAIVSATGREGKTSAALWLAKTVSNAGHRVLLIDGDHRRGLIGRHLGDEDGPGWSEVVFDHLPFRTCVKRGKNERFDFVSAGRPTAHAFGPHDITRLRVIMGELEAEYDLVIIDTPPLLAMSDALLYAVTATTTILLCRWKSTSVQAVETCVARLREGGARLSGVVLSMVDHDRLAQYSADYSARDVQVMKHYYMSN